MPPIVSLVGKPDSGKTTLLEKLIPELAGLGYRVGTIKHHVHDFEMDQPGKDTWRHKKAGAYCVALSSPTGLGIIRDTDHDLSIDELAARYFSDTDIIITEGYKRAGMPKIEVFRSAAHKEPIAGRDSTWIAMVSDVPLEGLPCFALEDIKGLAAFLVDRFMAPSHTPQTTLVVDGNIIPLNSFVRTFLRQAVLGMTTSLKGCDTPKDITIHIRQ